MSAGITSVTLIGAGNVAWHLGHGLKNAGIITRQVWSRSAASARELAAELDCSWTVSLQDVDTSSDCVLVSIADKALDEVTHSLRLPAGKLIVHTSGTSPMGILHQSSACSGVFYPLQTFTKKIPVDLSMVPFLVEASSPAMLDKLKALALRLSGRLIVADSETRMEIHLAAVFVSNFPNLLYTIASEIMEAQGLDNSLLHPLMAETVRKATSSNPRSVQTGPARRGDRNIMEKHLQLLAGKPEYEAVYRLLSETIMNIYSKPKDA